MVSSSFCVRDAFQKKNYVDRETFPKEGRGVVPFPYKNIPEIGNTPVLVGGLAKNLYNQKVLLKGPVWSNKGPRLVMDLFGFSSCAPIVP